MAFQEGFDRKQLFPPFLHCLKTVDQLLTRMSDRL